MYKHFISTYLNFTKKERTGVIALLVIIVLLMLFPFVYSFLNKTEEASFINVPKEAVLLKLKDSSNRKEYSSYQHEEENHFAEEANNLTKFELFYFDPNKLDEAGWKKLGIRDKTIHTIRNYISKGGKFYKPEDIGKIWGFRKEEVERLMPYVKIENTFKTNYSSNNNFYKKIDYTPKLIDVNEADTSTYIALPGIGNKLANRIVSFRNKLGGFYKIEQVGETFGLSDSVFQKIKARLTITTNNVKRIDINKATIDELKAHPYIRYYVANAIVQYRNQHGNYSSVNDLKKITIITDQNFNKMLPYVVVTP